MNISARKRKYVPWFFAMVAPFAWLPSPVANVQSSPTESVRVELIRMQEEKGLTLAWVDRNSIARSYFKHSDEYVVNGVYFRKRALVKIDNSLDVFRPNEFSSEKYPEVSGLGECWSHDQTRVVSTMIQHPSGKATLAILDLNSGHVRAIAINVDQRTFVTSQRWSPDDRKLVYETDGNVRLYDVDNDLADAVAKGTDPTWSPDGNWIAFRDRDTYYEMHPDGSGRKKLFRNHWGDAESALYWSPDSRIVAYVRELGFLQGGFLDAEVNQLRARPGGRFRRLVVSGQRRLVCELPLDYQRRHDETCGRSIQGAQLAPKLAPKLASKLASKPGHSSERRRMRHPFRSIAAGQED
jgi:WD40-like Beta Propeller Repeat